MQARKFAVFESVPRGRTADSDIGGGLPFWAEALGRPRSNLGVTSWRVQKIRHRAFPPTGRIGFEGFEEVVKAQLEIPDAEEATAERVLRKRFPEDELPGNAAAASGSSPLPDWVDVVVRNFQEYSAELARRRRSRHSTQQEDEHDSRQGASNAEDGSSPFLEKCGSAWTFLSFYASTTYVNMEHLTKLIRDLHELFPCEEGSQRSRGENAGSEGNKLQALLEDEAESTTGSHHGAGAAGSSFSGSGWPDGTPSETEAEDDASSRTSPPYFDLVSKLPPLAVAYIHTESHVEPSAGVLLNAPAVRQLGRCSVYVKASKKSSLHPEIHKFISVSDELAVEFRAKYGLDLPQLQLQDNVLGSDVYHMLKFCGVLLVHSRRFAPNLTGLITYSTWRRPHRAPIAELVTAGQVHNGQRMLALSMYGEKRKEWLDKKTYSLTEESLLDFGTGGRHSQRFRFEKEIEKSRIPGGVFVGDIVMTYRSEHFLADAQATNDKRIRKKDET
eukprot:g14469.t1